MNCSSCGKPYRIINQKYKLCSICNHKRLHKDEPKKTYQLKRTRIKTQRKKTGEGELFVKVIWSSRPHICVNCQGYLGDVPKAHYFSHIKGKDTNPELRNDPNNIQLSCFPCHDAWEYRGIEKYNARRGINKGKYVGNDL